VENYITTTVSGDLRKFSKLLKGTSKDDRLYIINHILRAYQYSPTMFDLSFECREMASGILEGTFPPTLGKGNKKALQWVLNGRSMGIESTINIQASLTFAYNEGKGNKSSEEVVRYIESLSCERLKDSELDINKRMTVNLLRLAGFTPLNTFRKGDKVATTRVWKVEPGRELSFYINNVQKYLKEGYTE